MRTFYLLCMLLFCLSSQAQFAGAYAPSNWITTLSTGSNGWVNTSGAPGVIVLTGSDGTQLDNADVDYTVTAIASGEFSFSWAYHTNDSYTDPQYDLAGVIINGSFTQLSVNTANLVDQSGTFSQWVNAGDVIGFRVRAVDNVEGNASFTISSFTPPGGVLPVALGSFAVFKQGSKALLEWSASSEINSAHFVVERSADAANFSEIGRVATRGKGVYHYTDAQPMAGINYYRLRMVDRDGRSRYSETAAVKFEMAVQAFSFYPNPARQQLFIRVHTTAPGMETLTIRNAAGVPVKQEKMQLEAGSTTRVVDISALPGGVYLVRLERSGATGQVIKQ
jgi:hypothetical protein